MLSVRRHMLATIFGFAALLAPGAAFADFLHADFDGDGVRDRIEVGARSRELAVRLSTGRAQRLQADDLILRFVVADVNRDGHPDVVASTSRSGLQIWINRGRGLFAARSHRVRHGPRATRHAVGHLTADPEDDRACNDRLFITASLPQNERPEALNRAPVHAVNRASKVCCEIRVPRGPPVRLS